MNVFFINKKTENFKNENVKTFFHIHMGNTSNDAEHRAVSPCTLLVGAGSIAMSVAVLYR